MLANIKINNTRTCTCSRQSSKKSWTHGERESERALNTAKTTDENGIESKTSATQKMCSSVG